MIDKGDAYILPLSQEVIKCLLVDLAKTKSLEGYINAHKHASAECEAMARWTTAFDDVASLLRTVRLEVRRVLDDQVEAQGRQSRLSMARLQN